MDLVAFKKYLKDNVFADFVIWNYANIKSRILSNSVELNELAEYIPFAFDTSKGEFGTILNYLEKGYQGYESAVNIFDDIEKLKGMYIELSSQGNEIEALSVLRAIQNIRNFIAFSAFVMKKYDLKPDQIDNNQKVVRKTNFFQTIRAKSALFIYQVKEKIQEYKNKNDQRNGEEENEVEQ